ncbi:ATP-binding protein [Sphingosinicella sp. CPCC 101087]|uniref:ATP-binding protein n=1 Tax=Sphingosinicella sp. CPCC 101087 TaxID=2497754 RepID=UPI00197F7DB9|nr:ATP-binding protein [Sphingosinicella sp. CPCC 101087]
MTDAMNFHAFPTSGDEPEPERGTTQRRLVSRHEAIGQVVEIAGSGASVEIVGRRLLELAGDPDPSVAMSGQVGSQIKIDSGRRWLLANVRRLKVADAEAGVVLADIDFLGEGDEDPHSGKLVNFKRGITAYPIPGSKVYPVTASDLKQMFAADERAHIEIGTVYPTKDVRAALYVDPFLGKHFALLGSTGTGKSTAAALIMHRICDQSPEGHIVMIDPHGEYSAAFKGHGELFNVDNLAMPYWLMNFEEHCEVFVTSSGADRQRDTDILAKCLLQARARNRAAEGLSKLTVDSPIPYTLSDLTGAITHEMGLLNKATDTAPFMRLRGKIDELKSDPRYQFMFSGMLVADSMGTFISRIFRLPAKGKPISIIDVSGVPSDIVSVVVAVLSRLVFDYAIWSRSEVQRPVLLVCEEAHRYVPADRTGGGQAVRKVLERIAKEGRKYGVSLGLITQRPSDLAEGVLSQCGTIIAMRLNNDRDQQFVKSAMPEGSRGFLDVIPALRNRECIVCGEGVSIPIRVAFDDLERDRRPASSDPLFSELWRQSGEEEAMVARVVKRWRAQGR